MSHRAVAHKGLHCFLRKKQSSRIEINHFIEILPDNLLKQKWTIPRLYRINMQVALLVTECGRG